MKIFLDFVPSVLNEKLGSENEENLYSLLQSLVEVGCFLYIDNSQKQITEEELKILKEKEIPVYMVSKYPFHTGSEVLISDNLFIKAVNEGGVDYFIQNPFETYSELRETIVKNNVI